MRIFPIVIALGLLVTASGLAAGESAKMTGQDQNATAPALHRAQSAKMHNQQKQNSHIKKITRTE